MHRGGDRGPRREEVDSYSSSRDYRAREREDRYGGSHGREDRGWDRDRGDRRQDPRRDPRRDDDRPPRRDRDLFEGRGDRGGRSAPTRAGMSERDEFAMQMGGRDKKKSPSPPPKKREPTPDLTDIVPITERKRRLTQWDIKPPGYENVTAEQAKLSGEAPLIGLFTSRLTMLRHVSPSGSTSPAAHGSQSFTSFHESAFWLSRQYRAEAI